MITARYDFNARPPVVELSPQPTRADRVRSYLHRHTRTIDRYMMAAHVVAIVLAVWAFVLAFSAEGQTTYLGSVGASASGGGSGEGTVTSVALTAPTQLTVTGSPITTNGTFALSWAAASANTILAGPTSGGSAAPLFRSLVAADIPTIAEAQVTGLAADLAAKVPTARAITAGTGLAGGCSDLASNCSFAIANTAVNSGSYTNASITVDAQGRIIAAANGSAGSTLPIDDGTAVVKGSADATRLVRIEADGITASTTRVITVPDADTKLPIATQHVTWAGLTAARSFTLPDANATIARTDATQTFTAAQTVTAGGQSIVLASGGDGRLLTLAGGTIRYNYNFGSQFEFAQSVAMTAGLGVHPSYGVAFNGSNASYGSDTNVFVSRVTTGVLGVGSATTTAGAVNGSTRVTYYENAIGANVASAATITPTAGLFHITGTTQITTINLPRTGYTGCIKTIPDGAFTTATGGNIALASTAVVSRVLQFCYDGTSWYPSY